MNKKEYDIKYVKENCKQFKLLLNNEKDKDIILYLNSLSNRNGYLKSLIRKDMNKW